MEVGRYLTVEALARTRSERSLADFHRPSLLHRAEPSKTAVGFCPPSSVVRSLASASGAGIRPPSPPSGVCPLNPAQVTHQRGQLFVAAEPDATAPHRDGSSRIRIRLRLKRR